MPANRNHESAERPDRNDARQDAYAGQTGTRSQLTTESQSHRMPAASWRNGRVGYASMLRIRIKSGTANEVERLFTAHRAPAWRELQARGELLSWTLVRSEATDDQYDLVTHWASKDAHDRNEDSFVAEVYAMALACYIAARPKAG
jgi:heme-degrading monooxygenase HmoA